jgi:hypothetical protein
MNAKIPECPRAFCFFFEPAGSAARRGFCSSLEAALAATEIVTTDRCGAATELVLGPCRRWTRFKRDPDWYEPHEPNLRAAGFAHDHFVDGARKKQQRE